MHFSNILKINSHVGESRERRKKKIGRLRAIYEASLLPLTKNFEDNLEMIEILKTELRKEGFKIPYGFGKSLHNNLSHIREIVLRQSNNEIDLIGSEENHQSKEKKKKHESLLIKCNLCAGIVFSIYYLFIILLFLCLFFVIFVSITSYFPISFSFFHFLLIWSIMGLFLIIFSVYTYRKFIEHQVNKLSVGIIQKEINKSKKE